MTATLNARRSAIAFQAAALLTEHGLSQQGWTFEWNERKRAFGLCDYRSRTIELSTPLFALSTAESSADTLLHELAHAIAPRGSGHGPQWRAACRRVGANPERCKSIDSSMSIENVAVHVASFKYALVCPRCAHATGKSRAPKARLCCGKCYRLTRVLVPLSTIQNR